MTRCFGFAAALLAASSVLAGDIKVTKDEQTGWNVVSASQGDTAIRMVPQAGANVFSIKYQGAELLKTPQQLKDLPGFMFGNPLLYPTPNRVRDSVFTFQGRQYKFKPNNNGNFLHGLVHSVPWEVVKTTGGTEPTIVCRYQFKPGSGAYGLFPHSHDILLTVTVRDAAVRFAYTVDNRSGDKAVPFGWAFHPWFLYQGTRPETFLTIPATHVMEAKNLLPTGKLMPLEGSSFDARKPKSLEGFVIDDVYYGMRPSQSVAIDFRDKKLKITLEASEDFTHLVVYTPADQPWFCVENQTCSTDAHNLYEKGLKKESHLILVEPGKTFSGFVEFKFAKY